MVCLWWRHVGGPKVLFTYIYMIWLNRNGIAVWLSEVTEIWIDVKTAPKLATTIVLSLLSFIETEKSRASADAIYLSTCLFVIGSWVPIFWSNNRTLSILSGIAVVIWLLCLWIVNMLLSVMSFLAKAFLKDVEGSCWHSLY